MLAITILSRANLKERWVSTYYGSPVAQEWRSLVIEAVFFWQYAIMALIGNPLAILLTLRALSPSKREKRMHA